MDTNNSDSSNTNTTDSFTAQRRIFQQDIIPSAVKPRHLVVSPLVNGDLYYSNGTDFVNLPVGAPGTVLTSQAGVPTWVSGAGSTIADYLATTGAPVNVSLSAPPTTGQVLVATSPTTATWQTGGGSGSTSYTAHTLTTGEEDYEIVPNTDTLQTYNLFYGSEISGDANIISDASISNVPGQVMIIQFNNNVSSTANVTFPTGETFSLIGIDHISGIFVSDGSSWLSENYYTVPPPTSTSTSWIKVTKTYTDFSLAATDSTIDLFTIPANYIVNSIKAWLNNAFDDGAGGYAYISKFGVTGVDDFFHNAGTLAANNPGAQLSIPGELFVFGSNSDHPTGTVFMSQPNSGVYDSWQALGGTYGANTGGRIYSLTDATTLTVTLHGDVDFDTMTEGSISFFINMTALPAGDT